MNPNPTAVPYGGMMPNMSQPPAEVGSIKTLVRISRILALIIGILLFLGFLGFAGIAAASGFPIVAVVFIWLLIFAVIDLVVWMKLGEVLRLVDQGQYAEAKRKTVVWMILSFIFTFILVGILLLIAYLKFDPVINWQRQVSGGGGYAPAPMMAAPPMAAPAAAPMPTAPPVASQAAPPMAAAGAPPPAPSGTACPRCGRPATWIAQYNRWYCYGCQQYV